MPTDNICHYHPIISLSVRAIDERFRRVHRTLCYLTSTTSGGLITGGNEGLTTAGADLGLGYTTGDTPASLLTESRTIGLDGFILTFLDNSNDNAVRIDGGSIIVTNLDESMTATMNVTGTPFLLIDDLNTTTSFRYQSGSVIIRNGQSGNPNIYFDTGNGVTDVRFQNNQGALTIANDDTSSAISWVWSVQDGTIVHTNAVTTQASTITYQSLQATGTFNTTAGALVSTGLSINSTATRVAGANSLTNVGLNIVASGGQLNYAALFTGRVGMTAATPTAYLHIGAGTATAGTAPLKFTAGTNLGTPENGAMEFDGTNLYITIAGTRRTINVT